MWFGSTLKAPTFLTVVIINLKKLSEYKLSLCIILFLKSLFVYIKASKLSLEISPQVRLFTEYTLHVLLRLVIRATSPKYSPFFSSLITTEFSSAYT